MSLVEEIKNMTTIKHPHVCSMHDIFQKSGKLTIIMDLCRGSDLHHHIIGEENVDETTIANWVGQMLSGLSHIHSLGVVHCDLKPQNIMFLDEDNSKLQIFDFGLSQTKAEHEPLSLIQGTPVYMPPEVLGKKYTEAFDLWSVGIITFEMLYGYCPFDEIVKKKKGVVKPNPLNIVALARKGFKPVDKPGKGPWFNSDIKVSENAKDFIKCLLKVNPAERPSANEALHHPWISNDDHFPLDNGVMTKLKNFTKLGDIQRIMLPFMLDESHKMNEFLKVKLQKTFERLDEDKSGILSIDNFKVLMHELGDDLTEDQYQQIFNSIDIDKKGGICMDNFFMWYSWEYMNEQDERFWELLKTFDTDNDGSIELIDLEGKLASNPKTKHFLNRPEMQALHKLFDKEKKIDIMKFARLIKENLRVSMEEAGITALPGSIHIGAHLTQELENDQQNVIQSIMQSISKKEST